MTYRELRQFAEIIRMLGYPNPVGIDSFDSPNFSLMAQLLQWLATLYDPELVILPDLSHEAGRVEFVRSIVQQMAIRSGIRLNPRKLYPSDRMAVRELLKLANPIYQGITAIDQHTSSDAGKGKLPPLAKISQLSSSVPRHSVELYDQLQSELTIRDHRSKILSTMPPLDEVEKSVLAAVDSTGTRLETLTKEIDRLNNDEDTLRSKIKQRKQEWERQSKRLMSVQTTRPAFMDEYELLEQELQELFKVHFQHYRNVDYYEHELQLAQEQQKVLQAGQKKQLGKLKDHVNTAIIRDLEQSYQVSAFPRAGPSVVDEPPIDDDAGGDADDELSNMDVGPASNSDDSF
jgi:clusterin-associated protein 1